MGKLPIILVLCGLAALAAPVTPDSFGGPYCASPAFGAATCTLGNEYIAGGLQFQAGDPVAVFSDPPNAWGGINGLGDVDLLAAVTGYVVVPNTTTAGVTGLVTVVAGGAAANSLLLEVFDVNNVLLGSALNVNGGVDTFGVTAAGIRWFRVSTPGLDTFGVRSVEFGQIDEAVPEPGTMSMLLGAGVLLAFRLRRR